MALDNQFGKGIGVAAGFDLGAQKPLDARVAVNTIAERDAHIENNRAYEGMLVYVAEANMTFQLVKGEEEGQLVWKEFGFNKADFDGNFAEAIEGVDNRLDAVEGQLANGGAIENRIAQNESDIDALQGVVGQPGVAGDENGEGAVAATGLHAELEAVETRLTETINTNKDTAKGLVDAEKVRAEKQEGLLDQAIKAEAAEARKQEGLLQDAIDAINNEENGILAQAKALDKADRDAQALVDQEQDRRLGLLEAANAEGGAVKEAIDAAQADVDAIEKRLDDEGGLVDRIEANEAFVAAQPAIDKAQNDRLDALEAKFGEGENTVEDMIADAQAAAEAEAARLDGVMQQALQAEIDKKVAKADYDAKMEALDAEDVRIAGLVATEQGRAEAAEKAINDEIANMKNADLDGSLANLIADEAAAREQADNGLDQRLQAVEANFGENGALEKRVKANEDAIDVINGEGEGSIKKAVADLVNGAPEALDTLDELAAALRDNADVLDAVESAFDKKLSDEKAALQAEIDADVKVVADELAKQKDPAQEGTLAKQIADEVARADAEEKDIRADFAAADAALKAELQKEIDDDVKAEADIARAAEKANADAIAAINNAENGILAQAKAHANGLDQAMDLRMDAIEKFVEEHDHSVMEQGIADNKAAIDKLNGAADAEGSVAKAVKDAVDAEATVARAAEEALGARIDSIFAAYDGDTEYDDLAPLA